MTNQALQVEETKSDETYEVTTYMENKLGSLPGNVSDKCCIYKVPGFILNEKEDFYQPSVMSIGPVFYNDQKLKMMQEVKWIYLHSFLNDDNNFCRSLDHYINYVRQNEWNIRDFYQEKIDYLSNKFIEIIVLDATFLVYHFMCRCERPEFRPPNIEKKLQGLMPYLNKDLFLLQNQIPFFVYKGIYDKAFGSTYKPNIFIKFTLDNIGRTGFPGPNGIKIITKGNKITDESNIKHLVDLQRMACRLSLSLPLRQIPDTSSDHHSPNPNPQEVSWFVKALKAVSSWICWLFQHKKTNGAYISHHLAYTAKELKDAGVEFVPSETNNPLEIKFSKGKLKISTLLLNGNTEYMLRSLIYFEQCHYSEDSYFIDYIFFLQELVVTIEDVQILIKRKIFTNNLGSDEDVKKLINDIGKRLNLTCPYYYSDTCKALNRYASTYCHRQMAILRRDYCKHPWVVASVGAAWIIFILTVLKFVFGLFKF